MEEEWGRPFVHESGHGLMAILQQVPCHGICYEKAEGGGKFCALVDLKPCAKRTRKDYLILAAGVAAERLIYGSNEEEAARADMGHFDSPGSPAFDEVVGEAWKILLSKKRQLRRLVSMLKAEARQVDHDLGRLPVREMGGNGRRYSILIAEGELRAAVGRP